MESLVTLEITGLGNDVGGVSTSRGRDTVFVQGALPGETVVCRITARKKKWSTGELVEVTRPSPHRRVPDCPYYKECGGCSLSHLEYSRQLFWKRAWVDRAMERMGVGLPGSGILQTLSSPDRYRYRNRVSFDITDGKPGLHRHRGDPLPVEDCLLLCETGTRLMPVLRNYDLSGSRRISLRASDRTGETMLEFMGGMPPEELLSEEVSVTAWNAGEEWFSNPAGGAMAEILGGLRFPVMPGTFFQVNPEAADLVVNQVLGSCTSGMRILDLYGGCGAISMPLAAAGAKVVSVELSEHSSRAGEEARRINGIDGVEFVCSGTRSYLGETVRKGEEWDLVVVDPPRAGLGLRISRLLRRVRSKKIIYVSCNPFSLARDLAQITEHDWSVLRVQPLDMFPQTDHVETIVELGRREET